MSDCLDFIILYALTSSTQYQLVSNKSSNNNIVVDPTFVT